MCGRWNCFFLYVQKKSLKEGKNTFASRYEVTTNIFYSYYISIFSRNFKCQLWTKPVPCFCLDLLSHSAAQWNFNSKPLLINKNKLMKLYSIWKRIHRILKNIISCSELMPDVLLPSGCFIGDKKYLFSSSSVIFKISEGIFCLTRS